MGDESLDIPNFDRENLDIKTRKPGRANICQRESENIGEKVWAHVFQIFGTSFPEFFSTELRICADMCGYVLSFASKFLNSILSRPTTRLMSTLSRLKLSARLCIFGSKSRCGSTHGATLCSDFPDSNSRLNYAILVFKVMRLDPRREYAI